MGRVTIVLVTILSTEPTAQQPAPAFEVASIKRSTSTEQLFQIAPRPGGRFVARNFVRFCFRRGHGVQTYPNLCQFV